MKHLLLNGIKYKVIFLIKDKNITLDNNMLLNICYYAKAVISPMCSILGSIIVFEVIKYTGKFNPLKEFFYLNFFDCLSD